MNKENKEMLERVKQKISISNFEEGENIIMKKSKKNVLKPVAIVSIAIISISGVAFAATTFIRNYFGKNTSDGVDTAVNNGYVADVKTDYQNADGIDIKVDSILIDDFNFDMNFDVKLSDKYDIDDFGNITDFEDLRIVDETGKLVFDTHNLIKEEDKMEDHYQGSYSFLPTKISDNEIKVSLSATGSPVLFPKSKHLTVDFTKIKTSKYIDGKTIDTVYEGNWHFEIDVPEEFYNRETTIYKVKSCNEDGIDVNKVEASLSNTAFKISIPEIKTNKVDYELLGTDMPKSIYDRIALQKEYVETSNGKRFETAQRSDGDGGYSLPSDEDKIIDYHQTFNLTKYDATDNLTVHIFTNKGEEIIIELERSK